MSTSDTLNPCDKANVVPCLFCGKGTKVIYTRAKPYGAIRKRRCLNTAGCGKSFHTAERVIGRPSDTANGSGMESVVDLVLRRVKLELREEFDWGSVQASRPPEAPPHADRNPRPGED